MKIVSSSLTFDNLDITKQLGNNDILYFSDVFDDSTLNNIISTKGNPKYILSDSFSFTETELPVHTVNFLLEKDLNESEFVLTDDVLTTHTVNFVINKKQINRYLAIKLCEFYNIDVDYTWSGIGNYFDMSEIINELDNNNNKFLTDHERSFLLEPITLPKKWISYPENAFNSSFVENYGANDWTWNNGINHIVESSAVSLITESVWTQRAMHFSEKTVYSVLGLTFPIWVGGLRQAQEWKKIGFDTFDDIIDHSYEGMNTLIERCWYAFKLNLELLKDLPRLADLRQQCLPRLLKNRKLLLSDQVKKYNDSVIATWPSDLQSSIKPVIDIFRRQHS